MEATQAFGLGIMVGVLFVFIMCVVTPWSSPNLYHEAIAQCEAKLPRDQHCKVIGVIDNDRNK